MLPNKLTIDDDVLIPTGNVVAVRHDDPNCLLVFRNILLPNLYAPSEFPEWDLFAVEHTSDSFIIVKDKNGFKGMLTKERLVNRLINVYDLPPDESDFFKDPA